MHVPKQFISSVILTLFVATSVQARDAAKSVSLSTGSNIATWSLPALAPTGGRVHQTPVVFLHGGPGLYTEDRRIAQGHAFAEAGFPVYFYDQIGSGQSARLPATQYSLSRMIADLEAYRVSLGAEKLVLWGNSWGSQLAILYAQAFPNRVAGLAFTSPGALPGERFERNYRLTKRTNVNIPRDLNRAIDQIDRKGGAAEPAISQVETGRLFDEVTRADLLEGMVCKASNITQSELPGGGNVFVNRIVSKEVSAAQPDWSKLPRVPALVVRGGCDFNPDANAARYVTLTGAAKVDIPNAGHALLEEPAAFDAALQAFAREGLANVP